MSYIGTKTGGHVFRSNAFNSVRYTGDGTTTQYNLPETVVDDDAVLIHIDGVKQHAPAAYSTSGTTLTFTGAPPSASAIEIILFGIGEVNIHTPTTNSVGVSALKTSDGTAGQVLTTDGAGALSFSSKSTETLSSMGVTSTAAELNILDGVTSTAAELNILDGVTSTASELNILDGVTASTAELNYVDGVTALIQTQLDAKETADTEISKTDVAETRTASINMADNVLQRPELKDYSETKVAMGANSIDLSAGNVHTKTISGSTTLTFDNPPATGKTGSFTLVLVNGGTNVTFPTVLWDGGDAPSLSASGTDILSFMTMDGGTTWYGFISGLGMA